MTMVPSWRGTGEAGFFLEILIINRIMHAPRATIQLDKLPLRTAGHIAAIDWDRLREKEARRLRELGFDEGVAIEALHRGPFGLDPLACRVGRMTVAIRRAHAAAISVKVTP